MAKLTVLDNEITILKVNNETNLFKEEYLKFIYEQGKNNKFKQQYKEYAF